jgi:D-alanyl-D-alanine carboxypeptidase/D-alanyl-D-alanine-endopeptidase (penicillin-binding protein 4)
MFTPRTLVAVLQQLHKQADWKTLQNYFPQPLNSQPFLKNKLPYVYAKTGTLRHNHNLSGYLVSKKGNIYVFSLMVNHHMASTTEVKQGMALFLEEIYKKLR